MREIPIEAAKSIAYDCDQIHSGGIKCIRYIDPKDMTDMVHISAHVNLESLSAMIDKLSDDELARKIGYIFVHLLKYSERDHGVIQEKS